MSRSQERKTLRNAHPSMCSVPLSILPEALAMDPAEQARFDSRLDAMTQAMHLHGLSGKTTDSYRRTLYRIAEHFGRCPDDLQPDELKDYFSTMLEQYSWSTIKVGISSL
jgi:integrase/recombinase XerD